MTTESNITKRLNELRKLKQGWLNGEGETISDLALARADEVARQFTQRGVMPSIYPKPDGGVSVESADLDVYVYPDGSTEEV